MKYLILLTAILTVGAYATNYQPPPPQTVSNATAHSESDASASVEIGDINNTNINTNDINLADAVNAPISSYNGGNNVEIHDFNFPVFQGKTTFVELCGRSIPVSTLSAGTSSTVIRNKVNHSAGVTFTIPLGVDSKRLIRSAESCELHNMKLKDQAHEKDLKFKDAQIRKLQQEIEQLQDGKKVYNGS